MRHLLILLSLISFSLIGCTGPRFQIGHYEGQLEIPQSPIHALTTRELVSLELKKATFNSYQIHVQGIENRNNFDILIQRTSLNSFSINIPILGQIIFKPKKYTADTPIGRFNCYRSEQNYLIDICAGSDEFKIFVKSQNHEPLLSLTAGQFSRQAPFQLEEPKAFTLKEAINRSLTQSFASRIEYQKMMQAQDQVATSYLNLLPRVRFLSSASFIGAVLTLNPFSMIFAVGDLAPFLFPTRWISARQSQHQANVQKDSYRIMQANLTYQVQTLAYKVLLYQQQKAVFENEIKLIAEIREKITQLHERNLVDRYAKYTMDSLIHKIEDEKIITETQLDAVLQALSGTLGLLNIHAVSQLTFSEEDTAPPKSKAIDPQLIGKLARARSMEARQIQELQKAAQLEKSSLAFQWLDPAGDPNLGLGFQLFSHHHFLKKKFALLITQEEERLTETYLSGVKTAEVFNGLLIANQRARLHRAEQQERMNQLITDLDLHLNETSNTPVALDTRSLEIAATIQDHLAAELLIYDIIAQERMAQAKMERLLLMGYFSLLNPDQESLSLSSLQNMSALPENGESSQQTLQ